MTGRWWEGAEMMWYRYSRPTASTGPAIGLPVYTERERPRTEQTSIPSNFHINRYCSYSFQWIPLQLGVHTYSYTLILLPASSLIWDACFVVNFNFEFWWKRPRYTYFLGQSPNFVLFNLRMLKFVFSDFFLWIFIKIHWNCYFFYIFQWILLKLGTNISWVSPQTLFFSEFWNLDFLISFMNFHQIFIEIATAPTISNGFLWNYVQLLYRSVFTSSFHFFLICIFLYFLRIYIKFSFKSLLLLQFPMDSFATRCTHLFSGSVFASSFQIFEICIFFIFWPNFHPSFIQIATASIIFNGFLWNSHGEDGLSCRPCIKFSGLGLTQFLWIASPRTYTPQYYSFIYSIHSFQCIFQMYSSVFRHLDMQCRHFSRISHFSVFRHTYNITHIPVCFGCFSVLTMYQCISVFIYRPQLDLLA